MPKNQMKKPLKKKVNDPRACFAFEVWVDGQQSWARTINARSSGKAKAEYHRSVSECYQVDFCRMRCRKIGGPVTTSQFMHNAAYRGMPEIRCGQRVRVGENPGVIVGHNESANFNVLFDDNSPEYPGLTLNVHPRDVKIIELL